MGGFAEHAIAAEGKTALKPKSLSFEEAAALPMAGLTALAGLRLHGAIRPGQSVLVNGAAGGVGHVAVQLAKAMGAVVTGVTSTKNLDFVRALGADHVIDYTGEDFTRSGRSWELVVDTVGNKSVGALRRALAPGGKAAVIGFSSTGILAGIMLRGGKNVKMVQVAGTTADLEYLAGLADSGKLRPVIDRRYPLAEVPAAIAHLETGHVAGKVVVGVV
jgi:NADPH:quinone reductase-like Zn-dependent oxidoreductase